MKKILERREIKRLENYSLDDWISNIDDIWLSIDEKLKNKKITKIEDLDYNFDEVIKIIKSEFPTKEGLIKYKWFLEIRKQNPKHQLLKSSVPALFVAILTTLGLKIFDYFNLNKMDNTYIYSLSGFIILWFLFIFYFKSVSKIDDRSNSLLGIVNYCLENEY